MNMCLILRGYPDRALESPDPITVYFICEVGWRMKLSIESWIHEKNCWLAFWMLLLAYILFIIIIGGILVIYIYIYVCICNKTSSKRNTNILTIKQNTSGSRSGGGFISTPVKCHVLHLSWNRHIDRQLLDVITSIKVICVLYNYQTGKRNTLCMAVDYRFVP